MKIAGKVVTIIAGAQGMAKATADLLLQKGAKVCMGDIDDALGEKVTQEWNRQHGAGRAVYSHCDVSNEKDIEKLFTLAKTTFGGVDIVFSNAGFLHEFNWAKCLSINLGGHFRVTSEALKHMSKENGGNGGLFVATSSICGLRAEPSCPIYAATKAGIISFVRSWGDEQNFNRTGVRFNCICPCAVQTQFVEDALKADKLHNFDAMADLEATLKPVPPEFVAEGIQKLIEDDKVNGQAMRISATYGHDYATFEEQPLM